MKIGFFLIIFLSISQLNAQNINIRIFTSTPFESFIFNATQGRYEILTNNKLIGTIEQGESIEFSIKKNKIKFLNTTIQDSLLLIRGTQQTNFFTLSSPTAKFQTRSFDNDLYVKASNHSFVLINDINFDKYIAGVVEAEGGSKAHIEYYKAQAVLCRTYAARFYEKHLHEGFNLCDGVHCQAYKGRCKHNYEILDAAILTTGLVIVDSTNRIASATYFANSGGQTVNSEDLWKNNHYYLRSKPDPFSIGKPGYAWKKEIPLQEWKSYLQSKGFELIDSVGFSFIQSDRKTHFSYNGNDSLLELKTMRTDLKLRSTFFTVETTEDSVILNGKGYGHGVGLSQEGAMEMARQNYTFDKIITFYFSGVKLMNMRTVKFFQIE